MNKKEVTQRATDFINKTIIEIATIPEAPSGPNSALCLESARLPGEPILFEKDGWGIYTAPAPIESNPHEGGCLTHIGCDCVFPNWAFAHLVYTDTQKHQFKCEECGDALSFETYNEFVRVYRFINNIQGQNNDWKI